MQSNIICPTQIGSSALGKVSPPPILRSIYIERYFEYTLGHCLSHKTEKQRGKKEERRTCQILCFCLCFSVALIHSIFHTNIQFALLVGRQVQVCNAHSTGHCLVAYLMCIVTSTSASSSSKSACFVILCVCVCVRFDFSFAFHSIVVSPSNASRVWLNQGELIVAHLVKNWGKVYCFVLSQNYFALANFFQEYCLANKQIFACI